MSTTQKKQSPKPTEVAKPTQLNPRTISISEYVKYQSYQMNKIGATFRTYKRSLLYIGGCLALSAIAAWHCSKLSHLSVFGEDYRGGQYLNISTIYDEDHYAYNREFQRMHLLGQAKIGDTSKHSKQLITDLGVQLKQYGSSHIPKRPPHEKFY